MEELHRRRPPRIEIKRLLSKAKVYGEYLLKVMKENPGNCDFFEKLYRYGIMNPLIFRGGLGGGSMNLAMDYLQKLKKIHRPHCTQKTSHLISIR